MMYPRLYLAKSLLRKDGVIFISIDDHEQAHLRQLCDQIFGAENFRNIFILKRYDKNINRQFIKEGLVTFNTGFEYVLCYSKSSDFEFGAIYKKASEKRQNLGYWKGFWNDADRPTMRYEILGVTPSKGQWKWVQKKSNEAVSNYLEYEKYFSSSMTLEEYWKKTGKTKKFIRRNYNGKGKNMGVEHWIEPSSGILRNTNWLDLFASKTTEEMKELFDFPKNPDAIKVMVECARTENEIVLDFFAGSCTTAHAVMQLNAEDGGNRQFICVQLPERCDEKSEAYKAGYRTIADIGKERIRRAAEKIAAEHPSPLLERDAPLDLGFKVFKLDHSNFKVWDGSISEEKALVEQLEAHIDPIHPQSAPEDILYELLLKAGLPLTTKIVPIQMAGQQVFSIEENALLICLEPKITLALIDALVAAEPGRVICRDAAFQGNDALKVNAVQTFKTQSKSLGKIMIFETV